MAQAKWITQEIVALLDIYGTKKCIAKFILVPEKFAQAHASGRNRAFKAFNLKGQNARNS